MKENRNDPAMPDRILAQMAQETPEMPADFHARWTEAVRAEAAGQQTEKKHEVRRQWRYILSAAAVFVFLIGGTLITRGMKKDKAAKAPAMNESAAAVSEAAEEPDPGMPETNGAVLFAEAVKDADAFAGGAAPEAAAPEAQADFAMEAEAVYEDAMTEAEAAYDDAPMYEAAEAYEEEAYESDAAYEASSYEETNSVQAASSAREKTAAAGETAMSFSAGANKAAGESMIPAQTAAAAMAPEPTMKPTAEPTEEPAEEPAEEPEEEAADDNDGFTGFLKDLGIFTLKTAAVAAAGAALAFLIACIHRVWKKRKK